MADFNTRAQINHHNVMLELESAHPTIKAAAEVYVRKEYFEPAVRALRQDFESHPVTVEIDGGMEFGNEAGNPSKTLSVGASSKNLYSFIGFEEGTHPTNAIRNRLRESSSAGPKMHALPVKKRQFVYEFEISGPDLDAIYEATPLPWAQGLSWAEKIETGIPGLARFVSKDNLGRSGGGYQAKNDVRKNGPNTSRPISYLTGIVQRFLDRFTR